MPRSGKALPRVGEVIAGKYEVTKILGAGGMGVVVAVKHLQLGELYAMKFLLPQAAGDAETHGRVFDHLQDPLVCGSQNVLFSLGDYGGTADDLSVGIIAVSSVGMEGYTDGTSDAPDSGCLRPIPRHDGTDVWLAEYPFPGPPGALTNPTFPVEGVGEPHGFVQGRRLYGEITGTGYSFRLKVLGVILDVASPVLTGHIVPLAADGTPLPDDTTDTPARFRIEDGLIAGRVRVSDLLTALSSTLCNDDFGKIGYEALRGPLCRARDLAADESADNNDAPCTDLSLAFRFTATQANIGSIADAGPLLPPGLCDSGCDP